MLYIQHMVFKTMEITKDTFETIGTQGSYFTTKDGSQVYYYNQGKGEIPILFLHTLRTQAEFHYKLLPSFTDAYNCYVLDWPGHGRSTHDPEIEYTADYMISQIIEFIEANDLTNIILVGESIGGTGALSIAAQIPERVRSVYSSNPYDEGLVIGKPIGRIISWLGQYIKEVGKDEIKPLTKFLVGGGFYDKSQFDKRFLDLISSNASNSKTFGIAFNSFLRNQKSWHNIRKRDYAKIPSHIPVTLRYSNQDWSSKSIRKENEKGILGKLTVIHENKIGHFSFLEKPSSIINIIKQGEAQIQSNS